MGRMFRTRPSLGLTSNRRQGSHLRRELRKGRADASRRKQAAPSEESMHSSPGHLFWIFVFLWLLLVSPRGVLMQA